MYNGTDIISVATKILFVDRVKGFLFVVQDFARLCWAAVTGIFKGPRYIKVSRSVRYRPEDLKAWLESRPAGGEAVEHLTSQGVEANA